MIPLNRRLRLFVVGNGPSGIGDDGSYHVDRGIGQMLRDIADSAQVTFAQPTEPVSAGLNYFGFILSPERMKLIGLNRSGVVAVVRGAMQLLHALWRADFLYLFFPGTLPMLVARLCHLLGKPYGVFLRGGQFAEGGFDGAVLRKAKFVLSVSAVLADRAAALNRNIAVVRSGYDMLAADAFRRGSAPRGQRPVQLLFVGRIDAEKGVPELLEAARQLHTEGLDFKLVLVGLGDLSDRLPAELAKAPTLPVHLIGSIEDRARLMRMFEAADIFILPSHHEGFARVLYEAMLKSCAVITTMVGGIPAVMHDGKNCLAIPVNDSEAIAQAIQELVNDPARAQRIADEGLNTVLNVVETVPIHGDALREKLGIVREVRPAD